MINRRSLRIGCVIALLWASPAGADTGLPMLVLYWPGAVLLLPAVILLEAACWRRYFGDIWPRALKVVGAANLASTLVGIPLTWLALVALEIVALAPLSGGLEKVPSWLKPLIAVLSAAWFLPDEASADLQLVGAAAILSVPFYLSSVAVERRVAARFGSPEPRILKRWSWMANALSYGAIGLGLGITWAVLFAVHRL